MKNSDKYLHHLSKVVYQVWDAILKIWLVLACCAGDAITALLLLVFLSLTFYMLRRYMNEPYKEDDEDA